MTFDLKRARELVWAASELKIWTPPGGTGYGLDLDKHREWQAVVEICDKQFPSAIDEIERLRAEHEAVLLRRNKIINKQDAKIKELEANCIYDPETGKVFVPDGHPELEKLRARNRDLEDTLRDAIQPGDADKIDTFLRDCMCPDSEGPNECCMCPEDTIEFCNLLKRVRVASQQLQDEGKIGPDAKPHCWQITDERILAIENAISSCVLIERYTGQDLQHETAVLRTMLGEVK